MQLENIIKVTLIILCLLFLGLQVMNMELQAAGVRMSLILLLMLLYAIKVPVKRIFFMLFLGGFALAEIIGFISYFVPVDYESPDYFYYVPNLLYILSYIFLMIRILKDMKILNILRRFWIHLIILIILDVYSVIILTGTTKKLLSFNEFSLEFFYNTVVMILLTVAMVNYLARNSSKSMNLLLGAIFIFFAEVIQMTYFYISDIKVLNVMSSFFLVTAFFFFYLQARIPKEVEEQRINRDLQV